ncbi:MAG: tyrosine-type recombinase/integrase [Gammaproteobacteria bacterium]|nr:tyrosine-type recombinase/integrase [Gammaproteobacteria bacterium]
MPELSPSSVQLLNGKIVLTKRSRSPFWQARFRVGRRWIRTSTKNEQLDEAQATAIELHAEAKLKEKLNLPITTRKFKSVAGAVKENLQAAIDANEGKRVFRDYIQAIDNYLIPFFGNHNVDTVDYGLLKSFDLYREQKLKRKPALSTISTHSSALNRVFDEAVRQGYMTQAQVPHIRRDRGYANNKQRRPDFTIAEYRQLYRHMRRWIKTGKKGKSTDMRYLLRDAVLFLSNTGIRYGTELYNLRWNQILVEDGDITICDVIGKTGKPRDVIPRKSVKRYLRRIQLRDTDMCDISFEQAVRSNQYVFRLSDGTRTLNLHQAFRKLMEDSELKVDPRNGKNRTLYSLRHFYITQSIISGRTDVHTIAKNCGTSIKMLEQHYSHLHVRDKRVELER